MQVISVNDGKLNEQFRKKFVQMQTRQQLPKSSNEVELEANLTGRTAEVLVAYINAWAENKFAAVQASNVMGRGFGTSIFKEISQLKSRGLINEDRFGIVPTGAGLKCIRETPALKGKLTGLASSMLPTLEYTHVYPKILYSVLNLFKEAYALKIDVLSSKQIAENLEISEVHAEMVIRAMLKMKQPFLQADESLQKVQLSDSGKSHLCLPKGNWRSEEVINAGFRTEIKSLIKNAIAQVSHELGLENGLTIQELVGVLATQGHDVELPEFISEMIAGRVLIGQEFIPDSNSSELCRLDGVVTLYRLTDSAYRPKTLVVGLESFTKDLGNSIGQDVFKCKRNNHDSRIKIDEIMNIIKQTESPANFTSALLKAALGRQGIVIIQKELASILARLLEAGKIAILPAEDSKKTAITRYQVTP